MLKLTSLLKNNQSGYIFYFLVIGIALALFTFTKLNVSPADPDPTITEPCYYPPPYQNQTIVDDGQTFGLLMPNAPVNSLQENTHLQHCNAITLSDGKERHVCKPSLGMDGAISTSVWAVNNDDLSALNLRFIDVSDLVSDPTNGNSYVNIYVLRNPENGQYEIPEFIQNFCAKNINVSPIKVLKTQSNDSFPPLSLDVGTVSNWRCETSDHGCDVWLPNIIREGTHYLYAFESQDSPFYERFANLNSMPRGEITLLDENAQPTVYQVYQPAELESRHITVIAQDPRDPTKKVGYRYAPLDRLRTPDNEQIDLNVSDTNVDTLQLKAFTPFQLPNTGWWTPECKPAIYLYPKTAMNVNVKVSPKGMFTYTDPVYDPKTGWTVKAYPTGKLEWLTQAYGLNSKGEKRLTNLYDYLYYESKIPDTLIDKPNEGFVVASKDLESFYRNTLPKLGLNQQETADYIAYWLPILSDADYYFIGLLSAQNISQIEPMTITPAADKTLRVRLYYEPLTDQQASEKKLSTKEPELKNNFKREGFTVVEWGGMVKQDKNHPFTCSI